MFSSLASPFPAAGRPAKNHSSWKKPHGQCKAVSGHHLLTLRLLAGCSSTTASCQLLHISADLRRGRDETKQSPVRAYSSMRMALLEILPVEKKRPETYKREKWDGYSWLHIERCRVYPSFLASFSWSLRHVERRLPFPCYRTPSSIPTASFSSPTTASSTSTPSNCPVC